MGRGARIALVCGVAGLILGSAFYVFVVNSGSPFGGPSGPDFDRDGIPDATDSDDDNDGMPDAWESQYGLNPQNPADGSSDPDHDRLQNAREYEKRSVPTDPDTDDDGPIDGVDVDPAVDVVVAFQYTKFRVEDPIDVGTEGDLYFTISMDNTVQLTSRVIYFDTNAADIPADFTVIFNVPDDQRTVHLRTTWMDKDLLFDDEMDVSGIGNALDVDYDLVTHAWTGDVSGGVSSGNDDGSTTVDEDDITVWFEIFDAVNHPDEINEVLEGQGSSHGTQDFSQATRALGHFILDTLIQWALDHPSFFLRYGSWGALVAGGLEILAIAVKFYRLYFLQNDDK